MKKSNFQSIIFILFDVYMRQYDCCKQTEQRQRTQVLKQNTHTDTHNRMIQNNAILKTTELGKFFEEVRFFKYQYKQLFTTSASLY